MTAPTPGTAVRITGDDVLGRRLAGMNATVVRAQGGVVEVAVLSWGGQVAVVPVASVVVRGQEAA